MPPIPVERLVDELKSKPFSMLTMAVLIAFAGYAYATHATAADIETLKTELVELAKEVDDQGKKLDRVLLMQTTDAIRTTAEQLCATSNDTQRRALNAVIDNLQADYRDLAGSRDNYPIAPCQSEESPP